MEILGSIKTGVETVQWFISTGMSGLEATQLKDELSGLEKSLPNARLHIDRAEWGRFKNTHLAELLSHLKDATYDAEDLLRQFHDQELRHEMEDADRGWVGKKLSNTLKAAKDFILGSKTRVKETQSKLDKAMSDIEGVLGPLDLNDVAAPGQQLMPETTSVLSAYEVVGRDKERDELIEMLGVTIGRENVQDELIELLGVPLTGPSRTRGKRAVVGYFGAASTSRGRKRLKGQSSRVTPAETNRSTGTGVVSVLAIVGIGGVGKTTLAQFIYNDARVKAHFDVTIWVCVSDLFDKRRITREILQSISGEEFSSSTNLNVLQEELMMQLMGKRFLLVLDDVWSTANDGWESFFAPVRKGLEGSMVLLTTRSLEVAQRVTPIPPIHLQGLPEDIFWEFFKKCAFGAAQPELYPQLQDIARSIAKRLCGSPLAAKTLGRLLNMGLTVERWMNIQKSELWELQHGENEILPALQLSYLYLPWWLKRCFAFCSMYPKDYSFERDEIVDVWVAEGFVAPTRNVCLEYTGSSYLDDLRSRFLFQTDPKFPRQSRYVMHDLIHDMAQSVSVNECFLMQDFNYQNQKRILAHTVRHMSIEASNECMSRTTGVEHLNKLRSLRFGIKIESEIPWFNQLSNILFLSIKGCKLVKLPGNICELNSLRCLDISHSGVQELPEKFWCLYNLQFFYANRSSLQKIHQDVTKLINLRTLALPAKASEGLSKLTGIGKLSSLRNLSYFVVGRDNGRRIGELKHMNQLSGTLSIKSIHNVKGREEAMEARLFDKQYLKALVLNWGDYGRSTLVGQYNEVLEALGAPPRIERLKVQNFRGDTSPSWFKPENLLTLRILELSRCEHLKSVPIHFPSLEQLVLDNVGAEELITTTFADGTPPCGSGSGPTTDYRMQQHARSSVACHLPLTRLTNLRLKYCLKLRDVEQFLYPEHLPYIKSIEICLCRNLVFLGTHKFVGFVHLEDLQLKNLTSLICPSEMVLPSSLRRLSITRCPPLEASFPSCLENLTSLSFLHLSFCSDVMSIPLSLMNKDKFQSLEELLLDGVLVVAELTTFVYGVPAGSACLPLTRLTNLRLTRCDGLRNVEQFLCPEHLPSIKSIVFVDCKSLVSLPVHRFMGFVHLQDLKMINLTNLSCTREMVLPRSLRRLCIRNCPGLSLPSCLENLTSIGILYLSGCNNVRSIPLSSLGTNKLQCLILCDCKELSSIGESYPLSQIKYADISGCDKLISEVPQPFYKDELTTKGKDELDKFIR